MHRYGLIGALSIVAGLLLFPWDAFAWGPVAHLDFALQILAGAAVIAPAMQRLLTRNRDDFLYGSIAADAIVGKSLTRQRDHCHRWDVARKLLEQAEQQGEPRIAFARGYLGHMGADVVAHNHIVPRMLITHFKAKGVGHIYWEMRSDEKLLAADPQLQQVLKDLSSQRFTAHHKFIAKNLVTPLFSHSISKQIYKRTLSFQRRAPWRRAFKRIDARSRLPFTNEELQRWRVLAVEATRRAVDNPWSAHLDALDPQGREALAKAQSRRKELRRHLRRIGDDNRLREIFDRALEEAQTVDIQMFEID